jgi:hypothetical protein
MDWKAKWERAAQERQQQPQTQPRSYEPATWASPWTVPVTDLPKAEATALFLLRTEIIGLRAWIAEINVPGITPRCKCSRSPETASHVVFHCPRYNRESLQPHILIERLTGCLADQKSAQAIAKWFVRSEALNQFSVAQEIATESLDHYAAFQDLEDWDEDMRAKRDYCRIR